MAPATSNRSTVAPFQLTEEDARVLAPIIAAMAMGELDVSVLADAIAEPPLPDKRVMADAWRLVVTRLEAGHVTDETVELISRLGHLDPAFPVTDFCLGVAYLVRKDYARARHHFERQLEHPSGEQVDLCRSYLADLDRR